MLKITLKNFYCLKTQAQTTHTIHCHDLKKKKKETGEKQKKI